MRIWMAAFLLSLSLLATASTGAEPRAARSVHLHYPGSDATLFYNELIVDQSVPGSYFMACGWNGGYFGIQQTGPEAKVVIFSVWDPTKGDAADAVPLEKRVEVLFEGDGVKVNRFGGEGTGGKSMFPHAWKIGETNKFLVEAKIEGLKTAYTGWYWLNDKQEWKRLVTFRTTTQGMPLKGYYSFVEDFRRDGTSVGEIRKARFGKGWVKTVKGDWAELTRARFTASNSEWESKENIDAGLADGGWFYLATGGETQKTNPLGNTLERLSGGAAPKGLPESLSK